MKNKFYKLSGFAIRQIVIVLPSDFKSIGAPNFRDSFKSRAPDMLLLTSAIWSLTVIASSKDPSK